MGVAKAEGESQATGLDARRKEKSRPERGWANDVKHTADASAGPGDSEAARSL